MKVLLVEDSPEVSALTVEYLVELGHEPEAVTEAEMALVRVATGSFDTVMTDVSLPGMSGIELAKALLKRHPHLPVVIASGYGPVDVAALIGLKSAFIKVLQKPYDLATLRATLQAAATMSPAR